MAITWADVVALAPNVATVAAGGQTAILAAVALEVSADTWGDAVDDGQKYLAAHLATLSLRAGAGVVSSETVGPFSTSYATLQGVYGSLGLTAYGAEYLRRARHLPDAVLGLVGD